MPRPLSWGGHNGICIKLRPFYPLSSRERVGERVGVRAIPTFYFGEGIGLNKGFLDKAGRISRQCLTIACSRQGKPEALGVGENP